MNLTVLYCKKKAQEFVKSDDFAVLQKLWVRDMFLYLPAGAALRWLYSLGSQTLQEPVENGFLSQHPVFCLAAASMFIASIVYWILRSKRRAGKTEKRKLASVILGASLVLYDVIAGCAGWLLTGLFL